MAFLACFACIACHACCGVGGKCMHTTYMVHIFHLRPKKAKSETLCNTHPKSIELAHSGWSYGLPTKYTSYDKKGYYFKKTQIKYFFYIFHINGFIFVRMTYKI